MTAHKNPTPPVDCREGAPMGRRSTVTGTEPIGKVAVQRIPIDAGGYDEGGAYWGLGGPLFHAGSDCGKLDIFFRVGRQFDGHAIRRAAKAHVRNEFGQPIKFYR